MLAKMKLRIKDFENLTLLDNLFQLPKEYNLPLQTMKIVHYTNIIKKYKQASMKTVTNAFATA